MQRKIDLTANQKVIEWLKADMVETVGGLFKSIVKKGNDATVDALATLIITAYVLGRRLGISYQIIEMRIKHKIDISIEDGSEFEKDGEDLAQLRIYLENKGSRKR